MAGMISQHKFLKLLFLLLMLLSYANTRGFDSCIGFMKVPSQVYQYLPGVELGTATVLLSAIICTHEHSSRGSVSTSTSTDILDHPFQVSIGFALTYPYVNSGNYSERYKGICFTTANETGKLLVIPSLYGFQPQPTANSNEGATASYLALPYQELVTDQYEYYTLSTSSSSDLYYSGFLLVGLRDNTSITIYPSIPLNITEDTQKETSGDIEVLPGQSHTVILHRRQTLYIGKDGGADVTGTRIVSDKPLTVISGHEAGSVPSDGTLEPMAQQIPPTQLWGDTFMIVPMKGHSLGQIIKVLSSVDNTEIVHYCHQFSNSSVILPKAGSVHEFYVPSTVSCYIKANNSVLVGQFPYSPSGNSDGDTTMILVPSTDQYYDYAVVGRLSANNNYISITVPVEYYDPDSILYEGLPLAADCWSPIYDNVTVVGYGCSVSISNGDNSISHATGGLLSVVLYGFGDGNAYGYPAALTFNSSKVLGVNFSSNNYTVQGEGKVTIIINRLTHLNYTDTYHFNTTSTNSTRFVPISKDIQFSPMESTMSVSIIINDNAITDGNEYFTVQLCRSTDPLRDVCIQTEVTILDDDDVTSSTVLTNTVYPSSTSYSSIIISTVLSSTLMRQTTTSYPASISADTTNTVSSSSMTFISLTSGQHLTTSSSGYSSTIVIAIPRSNIRHTDRVTTRHSTTVLPHTISTSSDAMTFTSTYDGSSSLPITSSSSVSNEASSINLELILLTALIALTGILIGMMIVGCYCYIHQQKGPSASAAGMVGLNESSLVHYSILPTTESTDHNIIEKEMGFVADD